MLRRYDDNSALRWMESNGGPLLLVPGEFLSAWRGIVPPSTGQHIEAKFRSFPDEPASVYDRACDVEADIGLLEVGAGHGLVVGGDPCGAAWLASEEPSSEANKRESGGILVRWVYANGEADVIAALEHVPESAWKDSGLTLTVGSEPLYLLDAAYNLDDLRGDDHLTIHLQAGTYSIATAEYEPDAHISLILHRLTRTDQ